MLHFCSLPSEAANPRLTDANSWVPALSVLTYFSFKNKAANGQMCVFLGGGAASRMVLSVTSSLRCHIHNKILKFVTRWHHFFCLTPLTISPQDRAPQTSSEQTCKDFWEKRRMGFFLVWVQIYRFLNRNPAFPIFHVWLIFCLMTSSSSQRCKDRALPPPPTNKRGEVRAVTSEAQTPFLNI